MNRTNRKDEDINNHTDDEVIEHKIDTKSKRNKKKTIKCK